MIGFPAGQVSEDDGLWSILPIGGQDIGPGGPCVAHRALRGGVDLTAVVEQTKLGKL